MNHLPASRHPKFVLKRTCSKICLLGAGLPLLLASHAMGALVIWQTPTAVDVNNAGQILTNGSLFVAGSGYGDSYTPLTINGVTFGISGVYGNNPHVSFSASSGGQYGPSPTDYASLLDVSYPLLNTTAVTSPMTISGLTSGQTYEFQAWLGYWYADYSTRFSTGVPDGATDSTATNESATVHAGNFTTTPSFIVGTFVADATTQNIYYYGNGGAEAGEGMITAYQIRAIAPVPEPQTWALAALGTFAVVFRLRRKQRTE